MGTVANLAVRISANASEFEQGIAGINTKLGGLESTFGKLGTAVLAAFSFNSITGAIEKIGDWGGKIVDFSNRLGISADQVQRFRFAAEQGGSSIEAVGRAIEMASRKIGSGDEGFAAAVKEIGVSLTLLRNQSPDQQFLTIARALNEIEDPAKRDALAFELFGRAGQEIQQFLPTFIADLSRAPVAMEGAAEAADALGDSWGRVKAVGETLLGTLALVIEKNLELGNTGKFFEGLSQIADDAQRVLGASGVRGAFASAEAGAKALRDSGVQPLTLSVADANRLWKEMDASLKVTNKSHAEAARTHAEAAKLIEKEEAAYRKYLNEVGVRLMEADAAQMAYFRHLGEGLAFAREHNNPQLLLPSTNLPTELLTGLPQQIQSNIQAVQQMETVWDGVWTHIRTSASDAFASMLFGVTSFKEGFISIWHSLKQSLMDIVGDIIHNVLGGLAKGLASVLSGGSFGAGFGGVLGNIGSMLGLGGLGGGGAAAGAGGAAAGAGAGGGGGGLGALFTNPWTAVAGGIAALTLGIWKGGLFRGGEEALQVNPARDEFFREFQDKFGLDQQGSLATALMEAGIGGDMADRLIKRVYEADTMKEFEAATAAVNKALAEGAEKATTDSATLGTTSAQSSMAVTGLATAIQGLTDTALASTASLVDRQGFVATQDEGWVVGDQGIMASQAGAVILDENGNVVYGGQGDGTVGGLSLPSPNYASGGVVSPQDMGGTVPTVNLYGGTFIGNSQEFEDAVAAAYNSALEGGGATYNKARIIVGQMVG